MHLIKNFTFDRNTFLRSPELSADKAVEIIGKINNNEDLDKTDSNKAGAFASYMGLFRKTATGYEATDLAAAFLKLYSQSKSGAWQWLMTRSLWLYVIPNGTGAGINPHAASVGCKIPLFELLLGILIHLQTRKGVEKFLYYDEFCIIFEDDSNWCRSSFELFQKILSLRSGVPDPAQKPAFLGELENTYGIPRDNFNAFFNKALSQTGLFEYVSNGSKDVGIALREDLDSVLFKRIRYVIDNPSDWDETQSWDQYLALKTNDLPLEASGASQAPQLISGINNISNLVSDCNTALENVGFRISDELLRRYISSLFTKRFVVLSGLTGSGKTKLAQLVAAWLEKKPALASDIFQIGAILEADRATYAVVDVNAFMIVIREDSGRTTPLPLGLIHEWADIIQANNYTRLTAATTIRDSVQEVSRFSRFIHGYSSQLKAAAFHFLEHLHSSHLKCYSIIPVEANWTSTEDILGYADALNPSRYIKREALELILRAQENYNSSDETLPFFLILDEMNLAHVERYFATILSAIESGEPIVLHKERSNVDGVPYNLLLPPNLFIIGTINVDETTYQFSPKVLDRANVIEFRVDAEQMKQFLDSPNQIDLDTLIGKGSAYAGTFISESNFDLALDLVDKEHLEDELMLFYKFLMHQGAEFGFRTAKEIARFVQFHKRLSDSSAWEIRKSIDAQVLQKILPKIHGSQRKLEPLLRGLAFLCKYPRMWRTEADAEVKKRLRDEFINKALDATDLRNREYDILAAFGKGELEINNAVLPLSLAKIVRMLERLDRDGFTSFAEA